MSIGPGADFAQKQSPRRWRSHKPGGRLSLLSTRPAVIFPES